MKNITLAVSLLLFSISLFAQNSDPQPIIFITDASGSMWQKVGEDFKISIAKEVLGNLVAELPDNQPIGLVAYGHRTKGDCGDIEALVSPKNVDKSVFTQQLTAIEPVGKTPLAASAKLVIDQLKAQNAAATIILITDGIETCEGDLCALAKEAKAAGVEFVLHIIGFDLKNEDKTLLECAAQAGEGIYIDASNKTQLEEALNETSDLKVDTPEGRLSVKCVRDGELVDTRVALFAAGNSEELYAERSYTGEKTNPIVFKVPSGKYDLVATIIGKRGITPIKITDIAVTEEVQEKVVDFTSGSFRLKVTALGEPHDAVVRVADANTGKQIESGRTYTGAKSNPMKKDLSPGVYDFKIKSVSINGEGKEHSINAIAIGAGETVELSHNFESAQLKIGATYQGALTDVTVNIKSVATGKHAASGRTYTDAKTNPKSFTLTPGKYTVSLKGLKVAGKPTKTVEVDLKAGDVVEEMVGF